MSDNVAITAGTGTTIAADEVVDSTFGTVKVQYVKIMDGTVDGTGKAAVSTNGALNIQGYQGAPITFAAVTTVSTLTSTSATGFNIATVTLRTFTGTSPNITFSLQASDDNTNWTTLQGINNSTGLVANSWTQAAALTAGTAGPSIDYTIGAYTNVRISVTAISGTTPSATFGLALQSMPYEGSPGIASLPALSTGSNTIGAVYGASRTTGGVTPFTLISAATTNATSVKASAGTVYGIQASNTGAAVAFLKLYNSTAAPTVGTSVAVKTLIIPAGGGIIVPVTDIGIAFGTGIALAITGAAATADTTAVAAAQVVVNVDYA